MKKAIIFIGPPGSGKGTQAKLLSKKINAPIIEAGELLRSEIKSKSIYAEEITNYVKTGRLVRENILKKIFINKLKQLKNVNTVLLDGLPRNLAQKKMIEDQLYRYKFAKFFYFYFNLDYKTASARMLKRNRFDDKFNIILNRFKIFDTDTIPILNMVKDKKTIYKFDSILSISDISKKVEQVWDNIIKNDY